MVEQDPPATERQGPHGLDILVLLDGQDAASDHPGINGDAHDPQGDDHVGGAGLQNDHDDDGQEEDGKGQDDIHHGHNQLIQPPAVEPRHDPQGNAGQRQDDGEDPHVDGDATAVDDPTEDVPP